MRRRRWEGRFALLAAGIFLLAFAGLSWPKIVPGTVPGYRPDSPDYVYGAQALLHGSYVVAWDGVPRVPRYPPGFSILLMPAVGLGGPDAALWVLFAAGLLVGLLGAVIAVLMRGPLAGPLAMLLMWLPFAVWLWSKSIMSDLPAAVLTLLELLLLLLVPRRGLALGAGVLAGALVWVRLPELVVPVAGFLSLGAHPGSKELRATYAAGALAPVALLALWQALAFGSPFVSGYQVAGATPAGTGNIEQFFNPAYVTGLPWHPDTMNGSEDMPNFPRYMLWLGGDALYLSLPGAAIVGLAGLLVGMLQPGREGVFGRFGLWVSVLTLLVYVPYFWQGARFLLSVAALLNLATAVTLLGLAEQVCRKGAAVVRGYRLRGAVPKH